MCTTSSGLLGIALGAAPSNGIILRGYARNTLYTFATADILYVSTAPGSITSTSPTGTGDIVRIIGYMIDSTTDVLYFNPDNTFIELS